jgi:hypothetical protein
MAPAHNRSGNEPGPTLAPAPMTILRTGATDAQLRIATTVAARVGLIGLLLAGIGIYRVTAYTVTQHTKRLASAYHSAIRAAAS